MESCPIVISHILAEFHPERATYKTLYSNFSLNGLSKSAQTFIDGFLKLLSTHPIHIVVWGNFPFNLFQILFEQVRFNYNQTWIIYRYNKGAQWEPSRCDAFRGHMTRSKVIGGQIVTVIWRQIVIVMVALFPAWTGSLRLQPNLNHRCTMGTFMLWRTSRSHDKVKCHFRSTSLKLVLIFCLRSFLFGTVTYVTF